jgi:hypothetical protein
VRRGHPLCVDLKRRLSATTSLGLNRTLGLARITSRPNYPNLVQEELAQRDLEASAAGGGQIGRQQFFSCCLLGS